MLFCFWHAFRESNANPPPPVADEGGEAGVIALEGSGAVPLVGTKKQLVIDTMAGCFYSVKGPETNDFGALCNIH